jgi:hypothetical protein
MKIFPDVAAFLSSVAMMARKVETYPSETHVIDRAKLRQIVREMLKQNERKAN